ncbi:cytochrome P450 [Arthrobacter sp. Sr24]
MTLTSISDPELVKEVMRRTEDFIPSNALTSVVDLSPGTLRILAKARFALPPVLASATGEKHRAVRTMVGKFFTPAKVMGISARVRELSAERLTLTAAALDPAALKFGTKNCGAPGHRVVDLAESIAMHIPPVIMAELTAQPMPELSLLKRWSQDSLELFWGWPDPERQQHLAHSAAEFYGWLRGEAAAARGTDSLFGVLHAAGLSQAEICSLGYFLVIAGQETTSLLISTALYRGIQKTQDSDAPAWAELAEPTAAAAHVRNVLATESSVHTWRRAVAQDTTLGGFELPAGAEILLELSGHHPVNASPTAYSLAFGHGLHRCLGAKLAELEAALVVEETARALPELELVGSEPQWLRLLSFQAPLTVNVARRKP